MILDKLRPYQLTAVEEIVARRRQLLADQPGLGKTYTALAACEKDGLFERPARILVLARTTGAVLTWIPKCHELLADTNVKVLDITTQSLTRRNILAAAWADSDQPVIFIGNHNAIEVAPNGGAKLPALFHIEWDAVIIDESQWVLPSEATARTLMTQFWRGLVGLQIPPTALRLCASGTPDRSGKLEYRYGTYKFLLPERYNGSYDYDMWLHDFFYVSYFKIPVTSRTGKKFQLDGRRVTGVKKPDLWQEVEKLMMIRRTKAEVAPELPAKQYVDVILPHPVKLRQRYLEFKSEFEAKDDGSAIAADTFATRARQFATCDWDVQLLADGSTTATPIVGGESEKLVWLLDWLDERGYNDADSPDTSRVVIASQYSAVLRWLAEEFALRSIPAEILDGSRSTPQRLSVQRAFQSGTGPRIILLNMSLGDSIDLDAADDLIFCDLVHSPDKTEQVEDRVHRVSRTHQVTIWRLRSEGTIDMVIATENAERYDNSRAMMDATRGVDIERNIMERIVE